MLALSTLHHAAFDRALFTLDADSRLQVDPGFETECAFLAETIVDRRGEVIPTIDDHVDPGHFRQRNEGITWIE